MLPRRSLRNILEVFPKALMYHESYFRKVSVSRELWIWIIQGYSAHDLTFPSDKLVTVSSFGRSIHGLTGDEYFAGLWREGFELQLLWWRAHWGTDLRYASKGGV
jgi:hypothetical protein